jgi:hypothetical protein
MANKKGRKKQIPALVEPNGDVHDTAGMLNIVVDYYKFLFGSKNRLDINLADDF